MTTTMTTTTPAALFAEYRKRRAAGCSPSLATHLARQALAGPRSVRHGWAHHLAEALGGFEDVAALSIHADGRTTLATDPSAALVVTALVEFDEYGHDCAPFEGAFGRPAVDALAEYAAAVSDPWRDETAARARALRAVRAELTDTAAVIGWPAHRGESRGRLAEAVAERTRDEVDTARRWARGDLAAHVVTVTVTVADTGETIASDAIGGVWIDTWAPRRERVATLRDVLVDAVHSAADPATLRRGVAVALDAARKRAATLEAAACALDAAGVLS